MTGKAYFDTAIFIYALENDSKEAKKLFEDAVKNGRVGTSSVTIAEYCTGCFKNGRQDMVDKFMAFLKDMVFEIKSVDEDVAMEAARIRGQYTAFKTCDALQIASAVVAGADKFYTNDKQLLQCQDYGLKVIQL